MSIASALKGKARDGAPPPPPSDGQQQRCDALDSIAPSSSSAQAQEHGRPPRSPQAWVHFAAGGVGGMCGAIVTSPLDVVKTRLQSDMYQQQQQRHTQAYARTPPSRHGGGGSAGLLRTVRTLAYHFVETAQLLRTISLREGPRALFKGLGPTLVGVVPARAINFSVYGNGKQLLAQRFNAGRETPAVHLVAATLAGIVTATATNPIWVVKTRLQLENQSEARRSADRRRAAVRPLPATTSSTSPAAAAKTPPGAAAALISSRNASSSSPSFSFHARPAPARPSTKSFAMVVQIVRNEGIHGLYKGMSASYLGVAEGTIQWALYEQLKAWDRRQGASLSAEGSKADSNAARERQSLTGTISAAGTAKLIASLITYPHEVIRTRLRQQPPETGAPRKYTGLLQTIRVVVREEGVVALYGGLSAHLLRVVPNAAVMFSIYELFLHFAPAQEHATAR
ncbi:mitochondrial carrier [Tilletiaria anomala UBC 951]|uniref:Mitochondrial carrier n=1 Tax=Tilletiaria anomala (strain ATCC 24038 / CBS 436.72 / UBC 951) TaxID=1037660 RepID=A0A066VWN7_TILAU|nr:mitochondrial carrier [Tilletiaria anomala UBC 951]KDN46152.1 mitochondrial carrier [Tilletiaria anomala UBC 951]